MLPHEAKKFWRSARAVEAARERSLAHARRELAKRASHSTQVFQDSHEAFTHLDFFREQFPQIIAELPRAFTAIEIGAGLGWHAALVAAHGGEGCAVLATEVAWADGKRPHDEPNLHAYHRLAQRDEKLNSFLDFSRDTAGNLNGVKYRGALGFARAGGEALPAADGCADFVYTVNCIEHIPDLPRTFAEAARVLRVGGIFFGATEPLYFSPFGHHLADIFPAPWGHLLWEEEEFADVVAREAGTREWAPGVNLSAKILREEIFAGLNGASPAAIRDALRAGPWSVAGWTDLAFPETRALARDLCITEALTVNPEALLLTGLRIRLVRALRPSGARLALRLPWTVREKLRKLRGK